MELEFRPYLRTIDLNKDNWRIKIKPRLHVRIEIIDIKVEGLEMASRERMTVHGHSY